MVTNFLVTIIIADDKRDFMFSFEKEACNLSIVLEELTKRNCSQEIKTDY